MFCPKCSQEQVSDETRFCSRCGFQLDGVKNLLAGDGLQTAEIQTPDRFLRKRDLTIGAALMFLAAFIVAALTVTFPPSSSFRILYLTIAWLALSLLINIKPVIQYFMRGESGGKQENYQLSDKASGLFSKAEKQSLPAAQSIPADLLMPSVDTADFAPPPSIAESTTNLLNK